MSRLTTFSGCMGLLLFAGAALADDPAPVEFRASYRIALDAGGAVQEIAPERELPAMFDDALRRSIASMEFAPGSIDGVPQPTTSWLGLRVRATATSPTTAELELLSVVVGPGQDKRAPPRYPVDALRSRIAGGVLLRVDMAEDGSVRSAVPALSYPRRMRPLVESALATVRQWTYRPEQVGGRGVATTLTVPICFRLEVEGRPYGECDFDEEAPPSAEHTAMQLRTDLTGTRIAAGG